MINLRNNSMLIRSWSFSIRSVPYLQYTHHVYQFSIGSTKPNSLTLVMYFQLFWWHMLKTGMVPRSSKCRRWSSEDEDKDVLKRNIGNMFSEPRSLNTSLIWSLGSGKHNQCLYKSILTTSSKDNIGISNIILDSGVFFPPTPQQILCPLSDTVFLVYEGKKKKKMD